MSKATGLSILYYILFVSYKHICGNLSMLKSRPRQRVNLKKIINNNKNKRKHNETFKYRTLLKIK